MLLRDYVAWTGDQTLVRDHWAKITRVADCPLSPVFRHRPSGLLVNRRDFWERHASHGIEPGLELAHQVFVIFGLEAASSLARRLGDEAPAVRWRAEADRLRGALLCDAPFGFVADGRLIKRRRLDGRVQNEIRPRPDAGLPPGVGLAADIPHPLEPDSVVALPIAWGFLDPGSPIAATTMAAVEDLWNQRWTGGGYARYHVDSDPDSAGAWPFASVCIARAYFEMGRDALVWRILDWLAASPGSRSGAWFETNGPRVSPPFAQVGIVPWAWAELILFFVRHLLGVCPEAERPRLRPRLLAGLDEVSARVRVRKGTLALRVVRDRSGRAPSIRTTLPVLTSGDDGFVLGYPEGDANLEIRVR